MESFVKPEIDAYCIAHTTPEHDLFRALHRVTHTETTLPQMQVGPLEGGFLRLLAGLVSARRVLEIGTFTGYSTLCMAEALPDGGEVIACDVSDEWTSIARRHWAQSPHGAKIKLKLAPAADTLRGLLAEGQAGTFDLAFVDADKENYPVYFDLCLQLVRPGGLMVFDNALWSGRVTEPPASHDEETAALHRNNGLVQNDPRVENVLLPVRDGMLLARKR